MTQIARGQSALSRGEEPAVLSVQSSTSRVQWEQIEQLGETHTHSYTSTHNIHVRTYMHMHIHMHIHTHTNIHINIHIHIHIHLWTDVPTVR